MDANGVSIFEKQKLKFSRLAHERNERFGGEFYRAKIIYKELLSAEGHRHYPLREPKCLRMTPDLMLPLGEDVMLSYVILCCVVLYCVMLYCVILCYVVSCCVMICYVILCSVM